MIFIILMSQLLLLLRLPRHHLLGQLGSSAVIKSVSESVNQIPFEIGILLTFYITNQIVVHGLHSSLLHQWLTGKLGSFVQPSHHHQQQSTTQSQGLSLLCLLKIKEVHGHVCCFAWKVDQLGPQRNGMGIIKSLLL